MIPVSIYNDDDDNSSNNNNNNSNDDSNNNHHPQISPSTGPPNNNGTSSHEAIMGVVDAAWHGYNNIRPYTPPPPPPLRQAKRIDYLSLIMFGIYGWVGVKGRIRFSIGVCHQNDYRQREASYRQTR